MSIYTIYIPRVYIRPVWGNGLDPFPHLDELRQALLTKLRRGYGKYLEKRLFLADFMGWIEVSESQRLLQWIGDRELLCFWFERKMHAFEIQDAANSGNLTRYNKCFCNENIEVTQDRQSGVKNKRHIEMYILSQIRKQRIVSIVPILKSLLAGCPLSDLTDFPLHQLSKKKSQQPHS